MGLFDWIKNAKRFTRFDDMYASTRPRLWSALKQTLMSPLHKTKSIWLVAHFTDTFLAVQSELDAAGIAYEVVTQPIDLNRAESTNLFVEGKLNLVLAELIPNLDETLISSLAKSDSVNSITETLVAMMVVERHPNIANDQRIESFARALPTRVELGYFNSLDDEVLGVVINETTMMVLTQLGLDDHELITSNMISRRLDKVLRRQSLSYTSNHRADSAGEWMRINQLPSDA